MADNNSGSMSYLYCADGLAAKGQDFFLLVGRVLLGWIFVQSGWAKLFNMSGFAASMPRRGMPEFMGYIGAPVEFFGGLAILLGFGTRYAALLILAFTIVASFSSHAYWNFTDAAQRAAQNTHFWKNTSMKGGLILLFVTGAGRFALDWMMAKRK